MPHDHRIAPVIEPALLGRRSIPRVHLGIQAKLVSVFGIHDCLLVDMSRHGALVRLARPLAINACGYLRAGPIEAFAITAWVKKLRAGDPHIGVKFDTPMAKEQFIELRKFAKQHHLVEERLARLAAADWANGK